MDELAPMQADAWGSLLPVILWLPTALDGPLKGHGLSHPEFLILWCLFEHRERTMSSLAEGSRVTPSHLSRVAARLEKQGWLVRKTDPADARCTIASLTEAGSRKYVEAVPSYNAVLREHLFERLSDEQVQQLTAITGLIAHSLDPRAR